MARGCAVRSGFNAGVLRICCEYFLKSDFSPLSGEAPYVVSLALVGIDSVGTGCDGAVVCVALAGRGAEVASSREADEASPDKVSPRSFGSGEVFVGGESGALSRLGMAIGFLRSAWSAPAEAVAPAKMASRLASPCRLK